MKIRIFVFLIEFIGSLPLFPRRFLGNILGLCFYIFPNRNIRNTKKNIRLCFPEMAFFERKRLEFSSINSTAQTMVDSFAVWIQPMEKTKSWITEESGRNALIGSIKRGPTLILLPHLGNWELFRVWLSGLNPATILYRPPRVHGLAEIIKSARENGGHKLVSTSSSGLRILFRDFKNGQPIIILPDQNPDPNSGVIAPFFNLPVLNSLLVPRLLRHEKAGVFIAACVPFRDGFKVEIRQIDDSITCNDRLVSLKIMNNAIESIVRKYPKYYQWEYNRFNMK